MFDAFARGIPVVLYRKTNMSQEVKRHGIFADNEKDAARIIQRIRKHGYGNRKREECRRYVSAFSWNRAIREVFNAYKDCHRISLRRQAVNI